MPVTASRLPDGYAAPIHRGVWERPLIGGVPRLWASLWLGLCAYVTLMLLTVCGVLIALLPLAGWALGHGGLRLLTAWEPQWDDVLIAQGTRRYHGDYDAG